MPMLTIEISDPRPSGDDAQRMRRAAEAILRDAGVAGANLSIAIVDDATIRRLNKQYLQHDCATDVLSFVLEADHDGLEGEVIVSSDTAERRARQFGWSAADELLLYVIHGVLHLVGYDDTSAETSQKMRAGERRYLALFGLEPNAEPTTDDRAAAN